LEQMGGVEKTSGDSDFWLGVLQRGVPHGKRGQGYRKRLKSGPFRRGEGTENATKRGEKRNDE